MPNLLPRVSQDAVRTAAYHDAIVGNASDFHDKVVLDVGTGSGILAYFAVKAGARKVYAVEASDVADRARILMQAVGLSDRIVVVKCKVEHLQLEEKVDIIISEPMGFMLVHERSACMPGVRSSLLLACSTRVLHCCRSVGVVHDCSRALPQAGRPYDADDRHAARRAVL